jgi:hypothetical protein
MVDMMSWHPRIMDKKLLIFGPRGRSAAVVRMWKDSGRSSATEASHNGS